MKYCLIGRTTKQPLSYKGKVLTHGNPSEMNILFPGERVAPLPSYFSEDLTMALKDHPALGNVLWPLADNMDQFID